MKRFLDRLDKAIEDFSDQEAFVNVSDRKRSVKTFAAVASDVDKTVNWLRETCKKGDRIAALTFNCTEAVILEWATYRLGGIWIGIPTLEKDLGNLERLLEDFTPLLLLVEPEALGSFQGALGSLRTFPCEKVDLPPNFDSSRFRLLRHTGPRRHPDGLKISGEPVARIRYTSGATGKPKAIAYTETTAVAILENILAVIAPCPDETVVHGLPSVWAAGSLIAPAFCRGGKNVLLPRWRLLDFVDAVTQERRTLTFLVPSQVAELAQYSERSGDGWARDLRALVAGGPAPISTMRRAKEALPKVDFFITLGQTEASFPITLHKVNDDDVDPQKNHRPFVPLGPLTPPYEKSEVDPDTGELKLRGEAVAAGKWRREEGKEGGFVSLDHPQATGDLVSEGSGGVLHYLGRKGAENVERGWVAPEAVEALVREHPGVKRARVDKYEEWKGDVRVHLTVEPFAVGIEKATLVDFFKKRRVAAKLPQVSLGDLRLAEVELTMSGKINRTPARCRDFMDWRELDFSCLASGPLYFYVGAGLSIGSGLVHWNEMACLIWWYLKHYEGVGTLSGCPADDAAANARFIQSFIQEMDRTGKYRILSRESEDPRGLGRVALLNMMLRYRAPRIRLKPIAEEARPVPSMAPRERPGEEPSKQDLALQGLIWDTRCSGVLTSNYDMLLEHAYSLFGHGAALRSYRYNADFLRYLLTNRRFILKLHGDINDIGSTEFDPNTAWESGRSLGHEQKRGEDLKKIYSAILQRGHMVYVGCGFRDRTIQELHSSWKPDSPVLRNCRVALIPAQEASRELRSRFPEIEFLTFSKWNEVEEFLDRVVAARSATQEDWHAGAEASDLHRQIFLSWDATPPVKRLKTDLWTCRGMRS